MIGLIHSHAPGRLSPRPRAAAVCLGIVVVVLAACDDSGVGPDMDPLFSESSSTTLTYANPIAGVRFYVDPVSNARKQANLWRTTRPADAAQMDKIAAQPQARWFGDWNQDVRQSVNQYISAAARIGRMPILVVYNIPKRDCGGLSGGGGTTPQAYTQFVKNVAAGIGSRRAVVVLEPDALPLMSCLTSAERDVRLKLLRSAVGILKASGKTAVYLDAGHPRWLSASVMADRLQRAGVQAADGFSLNVSNFISTAENVTYGRAISSRIGGKHFVIDTSRNGRGPTPDLQWCNPSGRALGPWPTAATGQASVDAYLWIKAPGESDGACNGGPTAGAWWPNYALVLARNAAY